MIIQSTAREDAAAYKAKLEREATPAAHRLDAVSREKILQRATAEGWTPSQAEWLDRLAKQPLFQAVGEGVPGTQALEAAYKAARRELTVKYFDDALENGKNRHAALLAVVDLEKQVAERRGGPVPNYPEPVLIDAARAVETAAAAGASSEDQIAAGFATIQALMENG